MGLKRLLLALMQANSQRAQAEMLVTLHRANGNEAGAFDWQTHVDHYAEEAARIEGHIRALGVDPSQGLAALVG